MEQKLHGKSKGGKVFAAFYRKLRGEATIRYDTIEEINVDSKAEYTA